MDIAASVAEIEQGLLSELSVDDGWRLIERFSMRRQLESTRKNSCSAPMRCLSDSMMPSAKICSRARRSAKSDLVNARIASGARSSCDSC